MENLFSPDGIPVWDFVEISTLFLLNMIAFFGLKNRAHAKIIYLMLGAFIFQWFVVMIFPRPMPTKIFATLMLLSVIVVKVVISRKKLVTR